MKRLWRRWCAYWLAPGGRASLAGVRIAIALSLLYMLWRLGVEPPAPSSRYYPFGPWLLFPGRPGPELLSALSIVAWASTLAMLVGCYGRAAHAISLVTTTLLAAYAVSDSPNWSHTDVPAVLASLALLGARHSDALSIDAWRRRRRGEAPPPARQTGARLVQLAVVSIFFIAGYCKLREGGFSLAWALSDNLRHQVLMRYDWIGAERTPLADWLIAEPARYRTAATLNLVAQVTPVAALFLFRFPRLRAALAGLFVIEVLGLRYVMSLWNPHWIPLAAAFVDWDALAARLGVRGADSGAPAAGGAAPAAASRGARLHLAFASVFVVFYAVQAFWLNQKLRVYPFSSFPLFAQIRAKQPYDRHQTYEVLGNHIELEGGTPLAPWQQNLIAQRGTYRWMWRARDPEAVRRHLQTILEDTRRMYPEANLTRARLTLAVFQVPAHPAPARFERHDLGVLGELELDGTFRTALGALGPDGVTVATGPATIDLAGAQPFAIRDLLPERHPLPATPTATGFVLAAPLAGDPEYLVAVPRGATRAWLVAQRSRRRY